ncbi:Maf family protein [Paenibacillus koleovorans]|uniref:Maf family protein n=1 Tax=Paenibacillus koleovorans TaxID=121608 RepID=UPI000FD8A92C|nr:Maf family protein [Paenibacillus koleovorans]
MPDDNIQAGTPLILASTSPRRRELIQVLGRPVRIMGSNADETVEPGTAPADIVQELSLRKAAAVLEQLEPEAEGILIGSDTIVVLNGEVLGKPTDAEDAKRMLRRLQGNVHEVYTGVASVHVGLAKAHAEGRNQWSRYAGWKEHPIAYRGLTGQYQVHTAPLAGGLPMAAVGHTVSRVTFGPMSEAEIDAYVQSGEPMDKAGSYGVQGLGSVYIEKIEGDFYSVMGLPLNLLYRMLKIR